ncbi:MAG TPA: DUF397 domain-containing protein [Candidatus Paceibacterota bacterium]
MKRMTLAGLSDDKFKTPSTACTTGGVFNCVAVAITSDGVGVRDTKNNSKTTLGFSREEWQAFVLAVKQGEFDVL